MPVSINRTKIVKFHRGQDAPGGGFINVASLMHDVVTKMTATGGGFKVVYASRLDTNLNTVAWGTLSSSGGVMTWAPGAIPGVGSPASGTTYRIGTGPTASVILEAVGPTDGAATSGWVNYLNPTAGFTGTVGGVGGVTLPKEPWRVKFELLSTESVAAYVATPLQLPGYIGSAGSVIADPDNPGLPGSHSRLTDGAGNPVDAAGAVGAKQFISSYRQITTALIANGGLGYKVGDYIAEDSYFASGSTGASGITYSVAGAAPARGRAIFKVETVTLPTVTGAVTAGVLTVTAVVTGPLTLGLDVQWTAGSTVTIVSISKQTTNTDTSTANTAVSFQSGVTSTTGGITVPSFTNIAAGQFVVGTGIPVDTVVSSVNTTPANGLYTINLCTAASFGSATPTAVTPSAITGTVNFYRTGSTGTYSVTGAGTTTSTTIIGTTGPVKSLGIVDPGKYPGSAAGNATASATPGATLRISSLGSGCTLTYTLSDGAASIDEIDSYQGLYNRGGRVGAQGASYPLTYELSITNSGFFLGIYESNWATQVGGTTITTGNTQDPGRFNWMLVQRPVDRQNGVVLDNYESSTSKHPVFCVNGVGGRYYTFVVREKDIAHPTAGPAAYADIKYYNADGGTTGTLVSPYASPQISSTLAAKYNDFSYRVPATLNTEDNHLLFNPENQISLTEDKKYLVTFPHNLSTPRFRYTEELDMIGFTSSDVLMTGQEITISTYQYTGSVGGKPSGDTGNRTYLALPPSGKYNTGLRICVVRTTGNGAG